jgi:hypothetical protein
VTAAGRLGADDLVPPKVGRLAALPNRLAIVRQKLTGTPNLAELRRWELEDKCKA